jgi:hypothetical protein
MMPIMTGAFMAMYWVRARCPSLLSWWLSSFWWSSSSSSSHKMSLWSFSHVCVHVRARGRGYECMRVV